MNTISGDQRLAAILSENLGRAVRSPVHSLLGFVELLGMGDLGDEHRRLQEYIRASAEELLDANERVLLLLRLIAGTHTPRSESVNLSGLVTEVAEQAPERVVAVHIALGTPRHVVTDSELIHQLLNELVANAVIHGRSPVFLEVAPRAGQPGILITVADSGRSLSRASRDWLVGNAGLDDGPATLGLMLVRRLIQALDGVIEVQDRVDGTAIVIGLALQPVTGDTPIEPDLAPNAADRSLRILLVEDNATNRLLTERQLRRLGHHYTGVSTGGAGVTAALSGEFDIILMDRHLPDMDGCEATRRIRSSGRAEAVLLPIAAVTADCTVQAHEECLAAGMDEVLVKPVDLEHLASALTRLAAAAENAGPPSLTTTVAAPDIVPNSVRRAIEHAAGQSLEAAELIATYLGELPGRRLRIQSTLRKGEIRGVVAAAESLRTSSEQLGASAVAGCCAALAAAAQHGDLEAARAFLPSLSLSAEQIHEELWPYTDEDLIATI